MRPIYGKHLKIASQWNISTILDQCSKINRLSRESSYMATAAPIRVHNFVPNAIVAIG